VLVKHVLLLLGDHHHQHVPLLLPVFKFRGGLTTNSSVLSFLYT
jgi:hypothetical protein